LAIELRELRIEGNTVFDPQQLAEIARPYVGKLVSSGDLEELRRRITLLYVERGYINSGVVIPDQQVRDGIVTFRIIEGRLTRIAVRGNAAVRESYLTDRLERGAGPPLNVVVLQERIQIMLQDPALRRLTAELVPGAELGSAELRVRVEERFPLGASLAFAN